MDTIASNDVLAWTLHVLQWWHRVGPPREEESRSHCLALLLGFYICLSRYHPPSNVSKRTEGCQDVSPAHRLSQEQPNVGLSNPHLRLVWFS